MSFYKKLFFVSIFSLLSSQFIFSQTTDLKTPSNTKDSKETKKNLLSVTAGFWGPGLRYDRAISEKSTLGLTYQILSADDSIGSFYGISYTNYQKVIFNGTYINLGLQYLSLSKSKTTNSGFFTDSNKDSGSAVLANAAVGYKWMFDPLIFGIQGGFGYFMSTKGSSGSSLYPTLRMELGFNF